MSDLRREKISSIAVADPFFDGLRVDYPGFDGWLGRKATEEAYVARKDDGALDGFLYLKLEKGVVGDVTPHLPRARRMKIGTFKVNPHGTLLGERLMKIMFDNAVRDDVDEIYVTIFPKHRKLIELFTRYGFMKVAEKATPTGMEDVLARSLRVRRGDILLDYPLFDSTKGRKYILGLYPKWHTRLLPDSKLNNEPSTIIADVSHANSIHKVYLAGVRGAESLRRGDLLVIYRTSDNQGPAHYRSVATSVCTVEEVRHLSSFTSFEALLSYCAPYSVFEEDELRELWRTKKYPTAIRFTYNAALPKRVTRGELIASGVIDPSAYSGFVALDDARFEKVLELGGLHASPAFDQA